MLRSMLVTASAVGSRLRVLMTRLLSTLGFQDSAFLLVVAVVIGIFTAGAAVGFHELIVAIRELLYGRIGERLLYGQWMILLVVWPMLGGLVVALISKIFRSDAGHGIVDVLESVLRSRGFVRPSVAIEKILSSAATIGSGGSAGAEGPIVQIGAAICSAVGRFFRIPQTQMAIVVGCGCAAGISAIFNSPLGGLLFTLEVILHDFSIRTVTPVVLASVVANVATQGIYRQLLHRPEGLSIFSMPEIQFASSWAQMPNFVVLGILCGLVAVAFTKLMTRTEGAFDRLKLPKLAKPALGGATLGLLGMTFVLVFGRLLLGRAKPIDYSSYPMPAFMGDGYGTIQQLFRSTFYDQFGWGYLLALLAAMLLCKLLATSLTLGSGGSGGIIAPALFLGASAGGLMGAALRQLGWFTAVQPEIYALVGMSAALAAIVHAPLAAVLILLDLTRGSGLVLPAMLASIVATGIARSIFPDTLYTHALRKRGLLPGAGTDLLLLRRLTVEQMDLEPATILQASDPFQRALDLSAVNGESNFVIMDQGAYCGIVVAEDLNLALLQREAIPLLLMTDILRPDVPPVNSNDDLASVIETFGRYEVSHLPVKLAGNPNRIIGWISRVGLMRKYYSSLGR